MHLEEIAIHVAPGAHAVLLLDQAGWHGSAELVVPPNITLLPIPPRCPELNPVENVWQFMRDNWLSNRIFKSYDDIVDQCCFAWNKLVDQPWRIMSIGLRQWAHGSDQCTLVLAGICQSNKLTLIVISDLLHDKRSLPLEHQQLVGGPHPHDFVSVHKVSGADLRADRAGELAAVDHAGLGIARRLIFEGFLPQCL